MVLHGAGERMNPRGIWDLPGFQGALILDGACGMSFRSRGVSVFPGKLDIWFLLCVAFTVAVLKYAEQLLMSSPCLCAQLSWGPSPVLHSSAFYKKNFFF